MPLREQLSTGIFPHPGPPPLGEEDKGSMCFITVFVFKGDENEYRS